MSERWAVIFNVYGEGTVSEGLIRCAYLPPPDGYSAAMHEITMRTISFDHVMLAASKEAQRDAISVLDEAKRDIKSLMARPTGCLRLEKGQEEAIRKGKGTRIAGGVVVEPVGDRLGELAGGTRVYVAMSLVDDGGKRHLDTPKFLYPAELGTYQEYVARWRTNQPFFPADRQRKVLCSSPIHPASVAA